MDREDPQFWRFLNHLGNGLALAGLLLGGASVSCADGNPPSPDPPVGMFFGLFLIIVGVVLVMVSSSTLQGMEQDVLDHHYEQTRKEKSAVVKICCRACRALNDEQNRFCGAAANPCRWSHAQRKTR